MPEDLPERIRTFVAIRVPPPIIENIVGAQNELQRIGNQDVVGWTRPEQLHVTLRFLGDVPQHFISPLEDALAKAVVGTAPFRLSLARFGCFPSPRNPSVFWAGLSGQLEALKELQTRIDANVTDFGSRQESREFHPHLTIGRARARGSEVRRIADALDQFRLPDTASWTVSEITLMRSKLSAHGAMHICLAAVKLPGQAPLQ